MRKLSVALLCLGLLGGSLAWYVTLSEASADDSQISQDAVGCGLAGVWLDELPNGDKILYTITPLTPGSSRYGVVGSLSGVDPTVGGLVPEAVSATAFHGTVVRSGNNVFDFTLRRLATDANGEHVYTQIVSGVAVLLDCDTFAATYSNGFIASDGEVLLCVPGTSPAVGRQAITEPCTDLPPLF